ncbi:MAG: hypothetical protein HXS46_16700 [Theionarchaea archaeon]|nr:MAG: hypothetical protein AYK18_04695 [Theionarchaea archaeon DG-70]MBU7012322.1 hypothetical protein [Theionarchaea archaeon]
MARKSKTEELNTLLKDLEATTPDIEASAIVSVDGLMIASALPQDVEEDRVAAGENAALTSHARKDAKLGLVFLDMKRAAGELAEAI